MAFELQRRRILGTGAPRLLATEGGDDDSTTRPQAATVSG
jgi:hypothetical protein